MKLGFSTGALFKAINKKNSNTVLSMLADVSNDVIEISCLSINDLDEIKQINSTILNRYDFKSLHAPALEWEYLDNVKNRVLLDELLLLHSKHNFDIVIFHPDRVQDWDFLNKYIDKIPITIENMNSNKPTGRSITEMSIILDKYKFKMLLDLQHVFSNDESLKLVNEMYKQFRSRIVAYHLSGQTEKPGQHTPLFKSRQTEIIESIPDINIPIIIESPVVVLDNLQKEYDYIRKCWSGIVKNQN